MDGQLKELEPHPAAEGARQWLIEYVRRKDAYALLRLQESFASCAIGSNRLAEICSETLRRLLNKEPVSDRYLLGLVWTIRDMEEKEAATSCGGGLVKEPADEQGFRPIESAPKDGTPIVVGHLVRYLPYKPDGKRQMKADGRWQEWNGHGWSNIDWDPDVWQPAKAKPAVGA